MAGIAEIFPTEKGGLIISVFSKKIKSDIMNKSVPESKVLFGTFFSKFYRWQYRKLCLR